MNLFYVYDDNHKYKSIKDEYGNLNSSKLNQNIFASIRSKSNISRDN